MAFTKEKQYLIFHRYNRCDVRLNINTGEWEFEGAPERYSSFYPVGVWTAIREEDSPEMEVWVQVLKTLRETRYYSSTIGTQPEFVLHRYDRLINVGYRPHVSPSDGFGGIQRVSKEEFDKFIKRRSDPYYKECYWYQTFRHAYYAMVLLDGYKKCGVKMPHRLPTGGSVQLVSRLYADFNEHECKVIGHWLNKGYDYYDGSTNVRSSWYRDVETCFRRARAIGYTVNPKSNAEEEFQLVDKNYQAFCNRQINERLVVTQLNHNLEYEDSEFIVVVPTTAQQFVEEANAQSNCVNSMYKERVADGNTNVVFIRRKSAPQTPYITCEVHDGYIRQYLEAYNKHPQAISALKFKDKYQAHLRANWR